MVRHANQASTKDKNSSGKIYARCSVVQMKNPKAAVQFHGKDETVSFFTDVSSKKINEYRNRRGEKYAKRKSSSSPLVSAALPSTSIPFTEFQNDVQLTEFEGIDDAIEGKLIFGFCHSNKKMALLEFKKMQEKNFSALAGRTLGTDENMSSDLASSESECENPETNLSTNSHFQASMVDFLQSNMKENFFSAQIVKGITSDHSLAKLSEDGMLSLESLPDILKHRTNSYCHSRKVLYSKHSELFRKWMVQLCLGFNVILYGCGSKQNLLESFRQTCTTFHTTVVNGFFPSLTLNSIVTAIFETCIKSVDMPSSVQASIRLIKDTLQKKEEALFLFIHCIDGVMMQQAAVQRTLSSLTDCQHIHIIATADHVNAPLLWYQAMLTKFTWLWYDVTTFEPYINETTYENSLILQRSGSLPLQSLLNIYRSLTPNAQKIFLSITEYHINHHTDLTYSGIPFQMLYQKCREDFLVNSDQTLRAQLTEFKDHKVIRYKKGPDGADYILVPLNVSTLHEFLSHTRTEIN